jgi:hypothetical protein
LVLASKLTWMKRCAWYYDGLCCRRPDNVSRPRSFCDRWTRCRRMWIYCRWPNLKATNHSGIRRDCARLLGDCRSLVVLTKGRDLRPMDVEIESEACEIEIQGCRYAHRPACEYTTVKSGCRSRRGTHIQGEQTLSTNSCRGKRLRKEREYVGVAQAF